MELLELGTIARQMKGEDAKRNAEKWCEKVIAPKMEKCAISGASPMCYLWLTVATSDGIVYPIQEKAESHYADNRIEAAPDFKTPISLTHMKQYLAKFCYKMAPLYQRMYYEYGRGSRNATEWRITIDPECIK